MDYDLQAIAAASFLWAAAVVSPGPAFAAILHKAVSTDRLTAYATVLGITAGSCIYGSITLFALLSVLAHAGALSDVVRYIGAGYLIWIGVKAWIGASRGRAGIKIANHGNRNSAFITGLMIELGNPKGIAFFVSVFAVAVPADATTSTKLVILLCGLSFEAAWYCLAAALLSSGPPQRIYRSAAKHLERGFGALFVGMGLAMLLNRH